MWKLHSSLPRYGNMYKLTIKFKNGTSNVTKEEGFEKLVYKIVFSLNKYLFE